MTVPHAATTTQPVPAYPEVSPRATRLYAISIGVTILFIFLQSITAGNFIRDGIPDGVKEAWTNVHGALAYPTMVFALVSTIIAFRMLRRSGRLAALTGILFLASVAQWLSGHMISNLGLDWVVPFHIALAFIIYGLAIVLSVRSAALRRAA